MVLVCVLGLVGCAVNPVTGKRDFVTVSEEQEVKMGREAHPQILSQYGRYDNDVLQGYVQRVGEQLAKKSHRSDLVYRFTVVDSDDVNAFALPGGYIYITRGLMAYLNSEAELAAVLGHELGHVTARHSVRQISMQQATSLGYAVGSIFVPELQNQAAQDLFNVLGNVLIKGYGREHELEADRLGAEYLARADYDPQAMIHVVSVLKDQEQFELQLAQEENREPRVYHGLFASHPSADKRLQQVVGEAEKFSTDGEGVTRQARYFNMIEDMTVGDSEQEGIRRGSKFYHKSLGFALTFPENWQIHNQPQRVIALPPGQDGFLQMSVRERPENQSARDFIQQLTESSVFQEENNLSPDGLPGYSVIAAIATPYGKRQARVSVVYHGDMAYVFTGAVKQAAAIKFYDDQFLDTAQSFHKLKKNEEKLAEALKIRIIEADASTTYAGLAAKSPLQHHAEEQLRLFNQQYPSGEPEIGQKVKTVQ
jgi:predicted Zn-dependent protease